MQQFGTARSSRVRESWRIHRRFERGKHTALTGVLAVLVGIGEGLKLGGAWGIAVASVGVLAGVALGVSGRRAMRRAKDDLAEHRRRRNESADGEPPTDARPG